MSGLDPLTNLPVSSDKEERRKTLNALNIASSRSPTNTLAPREVQGTFGSYSPDTRIVEGENFNQSRAVNQSGWELLGKATANTVGGIILGESISAVGYMLDFPRYIARALMDAPGDTQDISREGRYGQPFERNRISRFGKTISDLFFNNFEVYQTERAQSGGLNPFSSSSRTRDASFWAANFPSVFSSVTLMIPALGASRLVQAGARAIGALQGSRATRATDVILSSFLSRHNYNMMEGYDLMDRRMQELQSRGMSKKEAKQIASEDASRFYSTGYLNLWKDITQWGILLRGANYASRNATKNLAESLKANPSQAIQLIRESLQRNLSISQIMSQSKFQKLDLLKMAGLEAFEEFNIQFQKNWSARNSDILLGLSGDGAETSSFFESYFSADFGSELKNKDTQNAMLMAFLGGPVISGTFHGINYKQNKALAVQQAKQAQSHAKQVEYIKDSLKDIEQFSVAGNDIAAQQKMHEMVTSMALTGLITESGHFRAGLSDSDLQNRIEMFKAVKDLTTEELAQLGLTEQSKQYAENAIKELELIGQMYEKNIREIKSEIPDAIAAFLTEEQYLTQKATERKQDSDNRLTEILNQSGIKETIDSSKGDVSKVRLNARKEAITEYLKRRETMRDQMVAQKNPLRYRMIERRYDETTVYLENELNEINEQLKESPITNAEKKIETALKKDDNWKRFNYQSVSEQVLINEGVANSAEYITDGFATELTEVLRLNNKELENRIDSYIFKNAIEDGTVIRHNDKTFIVEHTDKGTILKEYDLETKSLTGNTELMTGDIWNASVAGMPKTLKEENLISKDEKEEILKELPKLLDDNDVEGYLEKVTKLWISGYEKEASKARKEMVDGFKKWVNESKSPAIIIQRAETLANIIHSETLKKELLDIAQQRRNQILENYKKEAKRLQRAVAVETKQLKEIQDKIEKVETDIITLKSEIENFNSEAKQTEVNNTSSTVQNKSKLEVIAKDSKELEKLERTKEQAVAELNTLKQTQSELNETRKQLERFEKLHKSLLKKYVELYQLDDSTSIITVSEHFKQAVEKQISNPLALPVLELDSDLVNSLNEAEHIHIEANNAIEIAMTAVNGFIDALTDGIRVSKFLQEAMVNSYQKLLESNIDFVNSRTPSQALIQQYKDLLNKELTNLKPSRKLSDNQLKVLNKVRQEIASETDISKLKFRDVITPSAFDTLMNDIGLDNLQMQYIEHVSKINEVDAKNIEQILKQLHQGIINETKEKEANPKEYEPAKKLLENVYQTTTGNVNTFGGQVKLPSGKIIQLNSQLHKAQIRQNKFVNNTNLSEKNVQLQIVRPSAVGIILPQEIYDEFGNDVLYAIYVVQEGNDIYYFDAEGALTTEFNPDVNIYTSFPAVETTIDYLNKGTDPQLEQLYKDEHQKLVNEILETIDSKENYVLPVYGKSKGKENLVQNRDYETNSPKPMNTIVSDFDIYIATGNSLNIEGVVYEVSPGSKVAYDIKNGNVREIVSRKFNQQEVDTIFQWLKQMVETAEIIKNNPQWQKEKFNIDGITISDLIDIRDQFSNSLQIDFKLSQNRVVFRQTRGKKDSGVSVQLFAKEGNKFTNKLANESKLKAHISDLLTDINNAKLSDQKIIPIRYKDGKFEKGKEVEYTKYAKENLAYTWVNNKPDPIIVDGVPTDAPQLLNQQFRFNHPYIPKEGLTKPKANEVELEIDVNAIQKQEKVSIPSEAELAKAMKKAKEKPTVKDVPNIPTKITRTKSSEVKPVIQETKKVEAPKTIRTSQNTGTIKYFQIPNKDGNITPRYIVDKAKEGEHYFKLEYNNTTGEGLVYYRNNEYDMHAIHQYDAYIEPMFNISNKGNFPHNVSPEGIKNVKPAIVKRDGDSWKLVQKGELRFLPDDTPVKAKKDLGDSAFQRFTKSRILTPVETTRLTNNLSKRTGIPINIKTKEQSLDMLEKLYEDGYIDEQFNSENLPHGMYWQNVAYIFGDVRYNTPFHEISHPIVNQIISDNPQLFEALKQEILNNDMKTYNFVLQHYKKPFEEGTTNLKQSIWAEIITTALANNANEKYDNINQKGLINAIQRLIEHIRQWFRDITGSKVQFDQLDANTTIGELGTMLGISQQRFFLTPSSVPAFSIQNLNQVDYMLKVIGGLQSTNRNIFKADKLQGWLNDLRKQGVNKQQLEIFEQVAQDGMTKEEIVASILGNYSFAVEINTAKSSGFTTSNNQDQTFSETEKDVIDKIQKQLDREGILEPGSIEYNNEIAKRLEDSKRPTTYYSNLTVPGGINYTENEISTPLITPSIKGHAQFATDKGIGWFRSDEQVIGGEQKAFYNYNVEEGDSPIRFEKNVDGASTKTRRILEVQSDLFQKGRDSKYLISNMENTVEELGSYTPKAMLTSNQFLQLLNKDNNWVTFFVKSIIQDSAKKGYEKVLFPNGKTISKIENFDKIEEKISEFKEQIKNIELDIKNNPEYTGIEHGRKDARESQLKKLKDDLSHYLTAQKDTLSTINFYENTVTNILKKQLGKNNVIQVTDEYGNKWNEITIDQQRDLSPIEFQRQEVKQGVDFVFNQNPELSEIGTPQQYSSYLDTVFPDSKLKDIVYHGTVEQFDTLDVNKTTQRPENRDFSALWFTDSTKTAEEFAQQWIDTYELDTKDYPKRIISALVDIQKPLIIDAKGQYIEDLQKIKLDDNDSVIIENVLDSNLAPKHTQYAVLKNKSFHTLGSKKDIEGFTEFVKPSSNSSFEQIRTESGKTLNEIGIYPQEWYLLSDSIKENIIHCN